MLHKGEEALGQASDAPDDAASLEGGKKKRSKLNKVLTFDF